MKMGSVIVENRKKVLTMAEYIKREALIDAVESIDWYSVYKGKLTAGAPNTENALYKASSIYAVIDNAPAADVAEVRHGRWISLTECANEGVYCSICKKKVWKSDYALCSHKSRNKLRSDYCPNCGAKMDGGDGNSDMV